MDFVISLPAVMWSLVTIFLMMGCWHPEKKKRKEKTMLTR